jgi:S-adenosylmethionine hydrolase
MPAIVTLTTDFGEGLYVASVKGALLSISPDITIVDICHSIAPQNINEAAFIIGKAYSYFPANTIHVIVVDPGVGTRRKAVVLSTPHGTFVAPDNGVLSYVIEDYCPGWRVSNMSDYGIVRRRKLAAGLDAVHLTNTLYRHKTVSPVFHGRDVFAPAAAHLARGVPLFQLGRQIHYLNAFPIIRPYYKSDGHLKGMVLHIDRFGNLVTNIKVDQLSSKTIRVLIKGSSIEGIQRVYAEKEGLIVLTGSSGYMEIALSKGNAARYLNAETGDEVTVIMYEDR